MAASAPTICPNAGRGDVHIGEIEVANESVLTDQIEQAKRGCRRFDRQPVDREAAPEQGAVEAILARDRRETGAVIPMRRRAGIDVSPERISPAEVVPHILQIESGVYQHVGIERAGCNVAGIVRRARVARGIDRGVVVTRRVVEDRHLAGGRNIAALAEIHCAVTGTAVVGG